MTKKIYILFLLVSTIGFSQSITSYIDSTQIKIGSQFNLTIKASVGLTDKVVFPEGKNLGALEILESYPVDSIKVNDKLELIKKYGLTQFDSGRYVIPNLAVLINGKTFRTDSVAIIVNAVVVDTLKQQMFDIKPIMKAEKPTSYLWIYILLGLLVLAIIGYAAYYFIKKHQNKKTKQKPSYLLHLLKKQFPYWSYWKKKNFGNTGKPKHIIQN